MADAAQVIPFDKLSNSDLQVDAVYLGGNQKNLAAEPIHLLVPGAGNRGGFRFVGSRQKKAVRLSVLFTSGGEVDWPDLLDRQTGLFTYYGDNREPGRDLHKTKKGGNQFLRDTFAAASGPSKVDRLGVPPVLLFERATPGWAVRFLGLLAPGGPTLAPEDELTAIWRSKNGLRFQNYRALFTVLDAPTVPRSWLNAVTAGEPTITDGCPGAWRQWVEGRVYKPLRAQPTMVIRTRQEQLPEPSDKVGAAMLRSIYQHFEKPTDFEACAIEIWRLIAPQTGECIPTRPSVDGGRDAVGKYPLGPIVDPINLDFALEAKCYAATTSVGVKDISRLIARLRPRNFGVFVTTSFFGSQAYEEIRSDLHPVALICGRDIVEALRAKGIGSVEAVQVWLNTKFPKAT